MSDRTAAAGRRPQRRAEAVEDGRDAPPRPRAAGHRQDPTVEPRGVPAHPGRGRDHRPRRVQRPHPACGTPRSRSPRPSTSSTSPPPRSPRRRSTTSPRLEWIRAAENVCLIGPAGTGKSHILVALGVAAVDAGHRVRYFTAAELVETLYRGTGRQLRRPRHRHPAAQRPDHHRRTRLRPARRHRRTTAVPASSPPPTNAAPSASARTGPSNPGAGSSPNTPPPSACSTGSCTTATSSSPTATATA